MGKVVCTYITRALACKTVRASSRGNKYKPGRVNKTKLKNKKNLFLN